MLTLLHCIDVPLLPLRAPAFMSKHFKRLHSVSRSNSPPIVFHINLGEVGHLLDARFARACLIPTFTYRQSAMSVLGIKNSQLANAAFRKKAILFFRRAIHSGVDPLCSLRV